MALNLWKVGGQPTSYNVLPVAGAYSRVNTLIIGTDYIVRFKAKSNSSSYIRVSGSSTVYKDIQTTPIFLNYEVSFKCADNPFYIYDKNNSGDIIIDSIELVQKPNAKLTVNGVDGFTSGKWNLHANATVIDDETLVLNATSVNQATSYSVNLIGGQTYTISHGRDNINLLMTIYKDIYIAGTSTNYPFVTFVAPTTGLYVIFLTNVNNTLGMLTFKRPMLNLGSVAAPYSRKTGDKMVMPVPNGKNLFDNSFSFPLWGSVNVTKTFNPDGSMLIANNNYGTPRVISPNFNSNWGGKTVTASVDILGVSNNQTYRLSIYDTKSSVYLVSNTTFAGTGRKSVTATLPLDCSQCQFWIHPDTQASTNYVVASNIQLEVGGVATQFVPPSVQLNKKPRRYVPKKNLVSNAQSDWEIGSGDASTSNSDTTRLRTKSQIPVIKNTSYTLSFNNTLHDVYLFDGVTPIDWITSSPRVITSNSGMIRPIIRRKNLSAVPVSDIDLVNLQIEQGTTSTPYEPYALTLPKPCTGLAFNGMTDYIEYTHGTISTFDIEVDFKYDDTNGKTYSMLWTLGGSSGTYLGVRNSDSYLFISTKFSDLSQPTKTLVPITKGVRYKVRYSFDNANTRRVYVNDSLVLEEVLSNKVLLSSTFSRICAFSSEYAKFTLYSFKMNNVVSYVFENASNMVGSTVLQNARNLIPDFEDARWNFSANTQVLGKDMLRLNATSSGVISSCIFDVSPNTSYKFNGKTNARYCIREDGTFGYIYNTNVNGEYLFTTRSSATKLCVYTYNDSAGTFDYVKPQLYALDGKEGTINGTPTRLNKSSRRTMYAKR